ncbi:MAG: hypothetical protein HY725_06500 [Candidatus Rokubacteria bacterium]|nr:hypothetical protein [Candidatus Rokubacteria bacterium]
MAFFEVLSEDQMAPEAREWIGVVKKRKKSDRVDRFYYASAAHPRVLKTFVQALEGFNPIPSRFGACNYIAGMLIAHAKRCRSCFETSRTALGSLGFDESTLDRMCELPQMLPLSERERHIIEFTLRAARDPQGLKPAEFGELERAGFSREEVLEMIGIAAYWNLATTLGSAVDAGLRE